MIKKTEHPANPEVRLTGLESIVACSKRAAGIAAMAGGAYLAGDAGKTLLWDTTVGNIAPGKEPEVVLAIPQYTGGLYLCYIGLNMFVQNNRVRLRNGKAYRQQTEQTNPE